MQESQRQVTEIMGCALTAPLRHCSTIQPLCAHRPPCEAFPVIIYQIKSYSGTVRTEQIPNQKNHRTEAAVGTEVCCLSLALRRNPGIHKTEKKRRSLCKLFSRHNLESSRSPLA